VTGRSPRGRLQFGTSRAPLALLFDGVEVDSPARRPAPVFAAGVRGAARSPLPDAPEPDPDPDPAVADRGALRCPSFEPLAEPVRARSVA